MIPRLHVALGAAALLLASNVGSYFYGVGVGKDRIRAEAAKGLKAAHAALVQAQLAIADARTSFALVELKRQDTVREIYLEIPKIVRADPVYRDVCISADGVQLLDRAAAAANGQSAGGSADGAAGAAESAAGDRSRHR